MALLFSVAIDRYHAMYSIRYWLARWVVTASSDRGVIYVAQRPNTGCKLRHSRRA